ncbi:ATP-binding cassette domain-containing protein [Demequina capsici]|uniref:ATP-binding cassette domain-containing protein n=1 Tax=Demequina capsici TaxID=3075620 RepID=A0AA96JD28_9MICO|nr:ATP-binding cassette domain-containing protein [Demequina sp. PMTSA13]WNM27601.1 ATP-binding cassette domain-containing protein [Demequina sp. PMTSA13]
MRLVVRDVGFTYPRGDHPVLTSVSCDIPAGTAAAIIGPSGSGKTTLLSLMGDLLPLRTGSIEAVDSRGIGHPLAEAATWVFQTVSLLPARNVLDNAAIGAHSDGAPKADALSRAKDCLARVGMAGRERDPARTLSGGEAQRVAIARAMASNRPLLLADEPTGQLDARTSAAVLDAMIDARGDRTVVIVTHDLEVAARCDMTFELRDGALHTRPGRVP